ncbi:hypothetical protein HY546_00830 [archaeon]|nr:hypothetical protein [archaeon]
MKTGRSLEKGIEEEIKKLVVARFETLNPKSKILLLGKSQPLTVKDLINAVREYTPLGKKIVDVQFSYLKMLANGEI